MQKRNHRHNRENDFVEFLRRVDNFLNSEYDQQVKVKKAYIIGIANLIDGSYAINVNHLKVFALKSKSSINGGFAKMGYFCPKMRSMRDDRIQTFFDNLLGHSYPLLRQWTIREKLNHEPIPEVLPPAAPMPQNSLTVSTFPDGTSGNSLSSVPFEDSNFAWDLFVSPDFWTKYRFYI